MDYYNNRPQTGGGFQGYPNYTPGYGPYAGASPPTGYGAASPWGNEMQWWGGGYKR
jgi:hypothetical protein